MKHNLLDKRILIIEDEKLMRTLLLQMIMRMGFKSVESVESAESAIKTKQYWNTDLIITDIEMDGMSGLDLIEAIRNEQTPFSSEIPVIVLSGLSELPVLMKAAELHIQGFLTKPVSGDLLHDRLSDVLQGARELAYKDPKLNIPERKKVVGMNNIDARAQHLTTSENIPDSNVVTPQTEQPKSEVMLHNVVVDLNNLNVGMILEEDILAHGRVILKSGKVIGDGHIKVLTDLRRIIDKTEFMVTMSK